MVSLEKYNCLCQGETKGLELFSSKKKGDQYIRCKTAGCGFFTSTNELHNYLIVVDEKLLPDYKFYEVPMCDHLMPATLSVSKSEKNPGRPYFKCGQREHCDYFQWGDTSQSLTTLQNIQKRGRKCITADKATMTEEDLLRPRKQKKPKATGKEGAKKRKIIVDDAANE